MTGSANYDIVSKGRRDLCGVKCIGVILKSKIWNLGGQKPLPMNWKIKGAGWL
jgi:uncharacterized membrane protein